MTVRVRISQLIVLAAFVAGWQLITYFKLVSRFILPGPYLVGVTFVEMLGAKGFAEIPRGIYPQLMITLGEIGGAIALGTAVALPLGFAIGMKRRVSDIYEPIVYLLYAIPGIVLYPVIYLVFGIGAPSKILYGAFLATWLITISTIAGLRQINPQYFRLAKSLKLSNMSAMFKVIVPAAAPSIISGFRLGLAHAIVGVIAGEIIASNTGLGYVIVYSSELLDLNLTYSVILLVLLIGFVLVEISRLIERRFLAHAA